MARKSEVEKANTLIFPKSALRSADKVRSLDSVQLGLARGRKSAQMGQVEPELRDDNERLIQVRQLLDDGYAGVILTGPPGTSKTYYARQIAARLVDGDQRRTRFVQFHASYQYEDFVEGYVPNKNKGFHLADKHLLKMCSVAANSKGKLCVLVIDELSRGDPARVFGEALTYVEMSMRGKKFHLASGREISLPHNLRFLATMNLMDRGVDDVDAALERRFAKIRMDPNVDLLRTILRENELSDDLLQRIVVFFQALQKNPNPYCRIGHAYFRSVNDGQTLQRLWDNQLHFLMEKAFAQNPEGLAEVELQWQRLRGTTQKEPQEAAVAREAAPDTQ